MCGQIQPRGWIKSYSIHKKPNRKKNVIAENLYVTEVAQVAIFICGVDG